MPLLRARPSSPSSRQGLLQITLSTSSPTLSLSHPTPFFLILTVRLAASTRPSTPLTLCTHGTILAAPFPPVNPVVHLSFDTLALGTLQPLQCTTIPGKTISLGNWRPNIRHEHAAKDMREREWLGWITVPAEGEIKVLHEMPLERMFKYEGKLGVGDLVAGEEYVVKMDEGHMAPGWWCWGDLGGELEGKRFSEWRKGWEGWNFGVERPEEAEVKEGGEWVIGEDPGTLWVERAGEEPRFRFVE